MEHSKMRKKKKTSLRRRPPSFFNPSPFSLSFNLPRTAQERLCDTEECKSWAVAVWSNGRDNWLTCEACQETDFGGWPDSQLLVQDAAGAGCNAIEDGSTTIELKAISATQSSTQNSLHGSAAPAPKGNDDLEAFAPSCSQTSAASSAQIQMGDDVIHAVHGRGTVKGERVE